MRNIILYLTLLSIITFASCKKDESSKPHNVTFYLGLNGAEYTGGEVITPIPHLLTGKVYVPMYELTWYEDPSLKVPLRYRVVVEVIDEYGFRNTYEVVASIDIINAIKHRSMQINTNPELMQIGVSVLLAPLDRTGAYHVHEIIAVESSPS